MNKPEHKEDVSGLGLDMGTFAVKGVLMDGSYVKKVSIPTAGNPVEAARRCSAALLEGWHGTKLRLGLTGANAALLGNALQIKPLLEIEALKAGLDHCALESGAVLSLGHENMYYLELSPEGTVTFFNRNGQCAAGSGAFWYQQASRMGYNDRELAEVALQADSPVKISGRCAVFAKSDMTHAINEGATQSAVSAGMARALTEMVLSGVAQNRIRGGTLLAAGGVINNRAVMKYINEYCRDHGVEIIVPSEHEYLNALGAAYRGAKTTAAQQLLHLLEKLLGEQYQPENPLPALDRGKVRYMPSLTPDDDYDLTIVYLGVDCGSVSTKCVLLDRRGRFVGGVYLPTAGRPALQVLELMKEVERRYGSLIDGARVIACTTGSGRFLSQKILNAEYAVDEITCQAEGIKYLCGVEGTLSIIEIGGEDSKFLQLKDGMLYDYNMNPVCAAGTGTFLENLAGLLGVNIKEEFSRGAFSADYAVDLGDTCTLLSQSALVAVSSRGLPLSAQLASLAYAAARNYISKTVESRPLEGKIVFSGATAYNHALAAAFAAECGREIIVPPHPELSGALGSALIARMFHELGHKGRFSCRDLRHLNAFSVGKNKCRAQCEHEHNCTLDVITFSDGSKFLYGDRCGRYSGLDKKAVEQELPDYLARRKSIFDTAAGEPLQGGPCVGIARAGLFFDLYPFWAAFFRKLGAEVVLSPPTNDEILEKGKRELDAEMCYPLEVLVGHYRKLAEMDLSYIFVPEVVDMEPLPWVPDWPRAFTCPLMQTVKGIVVNSLKVPQERILYAQLNYRAGRERICNQLEAAARCILGPDFHREKLQAAVDAGYRSQEYFRSLMMEESSRVMAELKGFRDRVVAVFLGRPYTVFDDFVSKGSLRHARERGIVALPQEFFLYYLQGWYTGQLADPALAGAREQFKEELSLLLSGMDNIYPIQLQKMLSTVVWVNFLNERTAETGLPLVHVVFQDPFMCGPNAMLRHYLGSLTAYLRLTLDEHTAPAGMITRLEAFKNTCRSRRDFARPPFYSARTRYLHHPEWKKILIPEPSRHARVFAAMFRNYGVEAEVLPRSRDRDLALARRYVNGSECLPLIQNVQDFLEYLGSNGKIQDRDDVVFFQGWACGPCRYGLYAPTQSLIINRAGYGEGRICSVKLGDTMKRFGLKYIVGVYDGMVTMDLLYKLLHATRPYELQQGSSDALFELWADRLEELLQRYRFSMAALLSGRHLRPLEQFLQEAAAAFAAIPRRMEKRPLILLGGEFYVRLDDRCNQEIIRKIEAEGGEVSLSPASELFSYTVYINYQEALAAYETERNWCNLLNKTGYALMNRVAQRDEHRLFAALGGNLNGRAEPSPAELRDLSRPYVSEHYGGEPPMAIGRVCSLARDSGVGGAVFVAPFTCMPASVVDAQMGALRNALNLPMVTIYYDGKENANRDEFIESLVFQARQRLEKG
ncbi:MAG: acyl-CoA dehydratase activase [Bacillota bacterium]